MTTLRSVRDEVKNVLDYLVDAELVLNANDVSMQGTRVSWHSYDPATDFMTTRLHATVDQYRHWVVHGHYSAILFDASILQITYDVVQGQVMGHRLAYIPCPFVIDPDLLDEGLPIDEILDLYTDVSDVALRSPVRFDYDPAAETNEHPAAHLTINSVNCRIACVAPMHVHRFADFVFRHFYPRFWRAHQPFFAEATWRHLGNHILQDHQRTTPHITWDVYAKAMS